MILVITRSDDDHADIVINALQARGADCVRFECSSYPQSINATIRFGEDQEEAVLQIDGRRVDLADVRTVWNRRQQPAVVSERIPPADRGFALDESNHILTSLYCLLRDRFWINGYEETRIASRKPYQLKMARAVGFDIPRTLMTSDPSEAVEFFELCGGSVVYKPFTQSHLDRSRGSKGVVLYTNRVQRDELLRSREQIRLAPCIFQEYVPKKLEFRVTAIGHKLFPAEIDSQKSERTADDWRRYDFEKVPHRAGSLPPAVQRKLLELLDRLGLVFGCIDLILTPDDRYVFLEVNPGGQWLGEAHHTGMPMLENFTQMLVEGTPCYSDPN